MLSIAANRRLARIIGILLPLAETLRRSGDLGAWWLWIDDWLIGAALLFGARRRGLRPLAAAWGIAAGMGYYSFVGHVLRISERDVSGLPGAVVTAAIGLGWLLVLYALASALLVDPTGRDGVSR